MTSRSSLSKYWTLVVIILAAFALRILSANARSVWYDEAFAILYSEKPFAQMWYGTLALVHGAASDVHPLFFYTLLHIWMTLVGESALAVRLLPIAFGVATVPILYGLVHALFEERVATVSALMLAFAPFHIAYSQEARMYAQLGFFSVLALFAYRRFETTRARRWWSLFILSCVCVVYSHNLGALLFAALGLWVLAKRDWNLLRAILMAGLLIFLFWLPWLLLLPSQIGKIQQAYWVPRPDLVSLLQTLIAFLVDFDNARVPAILLPLGLFGALLLLALVILQVFRKGTMSARFAFCIAAVPPVLLIALSQWQPLYLTRVLIASFLMLLALAAWLIANIPSSIRSAIGAALFGLAGISFFFYYQYAEFPRPPFREAAAYLAVNARPEDAVVHDNKLSFFPMHYYDRRLAQTFIADPPGAGSDTLALPTQQALQLFASTPGDATDGKERVWFVIFEEAVDQGGGNLKSLDEQYDCAESQHFNDLAIFLCRKKM